MNKSSIRTHRGTERTPFQFWVLGSKFRPEVHLRTENWDAADQACRPLVARVQPAAGSALFGGLNVNPFCEDIPKWIQSQCIQEDSQIWTILWPFLKRVGFLSRHFPFHPWYPPSIFFSPEHLCLSARQCLSLNPQCDDLLVEAWIPQNGRPPGSQHPLSHREGFFRWALIEIDIDSYGKSTAMAWTQMILPQIWEFRGWAKITRFA